MEASHPHLTTQKSFYVEISRALDRAELVTDDRAALKEQLEAATGDRIAAFETVEPDKAKGRKAAPEDGRSSGRERDTSGSRQPDRTPGVEQAHAPKGVDRELGLSSTPARRSRSRFRGGPTERPPQRVEAPPCAAFLRCSRIAAARIMAAPGRRASWWNGSMGTVLEDVTSQTIDAEHIRRRVDDWEERLNGLYATIGGWLPNGWEAHRGQPVRMHEELMRKFGIGRKELPTLALSGGADDAARLEPRGLWIIGSNGRVDLKRPGRRYVIVDMAENFQAPDWQAAPAERRCDREAVTESWLRRILQ